MMSEIINTGYQIIEKIDLNVLLSALIGGLMACYGALKAVDKTYQCEREKRAKDEVENLQAFLSAIHAEISTLWERYVWGVGADLEKLKDGEPVLFTYPVMQDYFVIYDNNALLLGVIKNKELRDLIILTYTQAKGLVDSYRFNNSLIEKYERFHLAYQQDSAWKAQVDQELNGLKRYAEGLKEQHQALKSNIVKLLKMIELYLAPRGRVR